MISQRRPASASLKIDDLGLAKMLASTARTFRALARIHGDAEEIRSLDGRSNAGT